MHFSDSWFSWAVGWCVLPRSGSCSSGCPRVAAVVSTSAATIGECGIPTAPSIKADRHWRVWNMRPEDLSSHKITMEFKRSEEHTSELQSLMRISYAVFCLKKKKTNKKKNQ